MQKCYSISETEYDDIRVMTARSINSDRFKVVFEAQGRAGIRSFCADLEKKGFVFSHYSTDHMTCNIKPNWL
jgi:hypothetical protein